MSRIIFRLIKLVLEITVKWSKFRLLKDYPTQKMPLDNSDEERLKNISQADIVAHEKEDYSITNRLIAKKLTNNYIQNLVQEKIGVEVIRIDEKNIDDDYFLSV